MPGFKNLFLVKLLLLNKFIIKIFKGLGITLDTLVKNRRVKSVGINIALNIKIFSISAKVSVPG